MIFRQFSMALTITWRDLRDQLRDWRMVLPMAMLAIFFPILMQIGLREIVEYLGKYMIGRNTAPMTPFLMLVVGLFPTTMSLVIALESFVGEKERGTVEPLLNTPLKDWQIYIGKFLATILLPQAASYIGMIVYMVAMRLGGMQPLSGWLVIQVFALVTVLSVLMVGMAVVVSSQTTSIRAANLLASFIILPSALLIQLESLILFWGDGLLLSLSLLGLMLLTILIIRVGMAHFRREELIRQEYDTLNLRKMLRMARETFVGEAHNLREWYLGELPRAIKDLYKPVLYVSLVTALVVVLSARETRVLRIPLEVVGFADLKGRLALLLAEWQLFDIKPVLEVWGQNVRALAIGSVVGLFSFGILGMLPLLMTMGLLGYIATLIGEAGTPVGKFLGGFILPHGLLEIPAAVITGAMMLQVGAAMASGNPGRSMGEIWLISAVRVARIFIGVVIPVLFVAAALEVWVTPRVALLLFR